MVSVGFFMCYINEVAAVELVYLKLAACCTAGSDAVCHPSFVSCCRVVFRVTCFCHQSMSLSLPRFSLLHPATTWM